MKKHVLLHFVLLLSLHAWAQDKYVISENLNATIFGFSDNFRVLASASGNNILLHEGTSTGTFQLKKDATLEYPNAPVFDLRVVDEFEQEVPGVIAVYEDGMIIFWRLRDKTPLKQIKVDIKPEMNKYHGDRNFFLTSDRKWAAIWTYEKVIIVDIEKEEVVATHNLGKIQGVSISLDKQFLFVAQTFGPLSKVDIKTGQEVMTFNAKGPKMGVDWWFPGSALLAPNGKYLAALGWFEDKKKERTRFLEIFDTSTGKSINVDVLKIRDNPVFSSDGELYAVEKSNGAPVDASVRSTVKGKELAVLPNAYYPLQFVNEGKGLVTHLNGKRVTLWLTNKGF